jgi:transketolase
MANMKVFVPCDAIEARKATIAAADIWGGVYLRYAREKTPIMTTEKTRFRPGKAEIFWETKKPQAVIIGIGGLLHNALVAAKELEKEKIRIQVVNCHTIKPMDEKRVVELAKKAGAVVTVEEHQVSGGLGGAVAEVLAKHAPVPIEFVGLQNVYGESGSPDELIEAYGMGVKDIKAAVKRVIRRAK